MKKPIVALIPLVGAALGISDADAAIVAHKFLDANSPNNLSIQKQKAIFAFSQDCASLTMALIENWKVASQEQRNAMAHSYLDAFYAAAADGDAATLTSEVGPSLLLADALGNAKALLAKKGALSDADLDDTVEKIKVKLMYVAANNLGETLVPYISKFNSWGQHGQHFYSPVPGPIAGAGLPALAALLGGGYAAWRRKKAAAAAKRSEQARSDT